MKIYLLLTILLAHACLATEESHVGVWMSGMAGESESGKKIGNTTELYLNADGTFRWYMVYSFPDSENHIVDKSGIYKIKEDILLLFYSSSPDRSQEWRFSVEGDTFWLKSRKGNEKIPYRRIKKAEQDD